MAKPNKKPNRIELDWVFYTGRDVTDKYVFPPKKSTWQDYHECDKHSRYSFFTASYVPPCFNGSNLIIIY